MQVKFHRSPPDCRGPRGRLGPEESGEHWEHIAFSLRHTTAGLGHHKVQRSVLRSNGSVQFSLRHSTAFYIGTLLIIVCVCVCVCVYVRASMSACVQV